jgi:hypothetical protein
MQAHQPEAGDQPFSGAQSSTIRTYLDTLLASPGFRLPARRKRLLRYLVDRSLAGDADRINEYSIGVDVFERPSDFDPKVDAVVRAEVSRLRQNLKDYYTGPGRTDKTVVDLPPRSYAPTFTFLPDSLGLPATAQLPAAIEPVPVRAWPRLRFALLLAAFLLASIGTARLISWSGL